MKRFLTGSAVLAAAFACSGCVGLGALGNVTSLLGKLPTSLPGPLGGGLNLPGAGNLPMLSGLASALPTPGAFLPAFHGVVPPVIPLVVSPVRRAPAGPFTGQESFPIAGARRDVLDVLAAVGRAQGYSVYSRNDDLGSLTLVKTWGSGFGPWRKHSSIVLTLQVQEHGHSLCVASQAGGDGKGYEQIAEKAERQFRAGVERNLR